MLLTLFRPSGSTRLISGSRGTILLEVMVSSLVLVVVILAIGTFFLGNLTAFDRGKEQMELQRMGTLVMEGMVRAIREGNRVTEEIVAAGTVLAIRIFYPGEPYFDANHNGVCDGDEDFIDIYQSDSDGSESGFKGVWNCASDGAGNNPMPTVYFEFDQNRSTILRGTDQFDRVDWNILVNDATAGSIWVDNLEFFVPSGDQSVTVGFTIRNDMATVEPGDDITMAFSSSVKSRE